MGPGSRQTPHPVDLLLYILESFCVFLFMFIVIFIFCLDYLYTVWVFSALDMSRIVYIKVGIAADGTRKPSNTSSG